MISKNVLSSLGWIFSVSRRFATIDRKGKAAATSVLAAVGIGFGVMALISVVCVMNGFQHYSINPVMEISSSHVRVENLSDEDFMDFQDFCEKSRDISCVSPFMESQGLIAGSSGKSAAGLVRGVEKNIMLRDQGFFREVKMVTGTFDLSLSNSIVLGSSLAHSLGARIGSTVSLIALAGGSDVELISDERKFTVTGIFECTYYDINAAYAFISLEDAEKYFGKAASRTYSVKLNDYEKDLVVLGNLKKSFPSLTAKSWREYNRSFFGALRVEKNVLMLIVCVIFIVAGINIYNGMRRLVFERRQEIAVFSALGARKNEIKMIFILRGLTCGICGALGGLVLGLAISLNISALFSFLGTLTGNAMFDLFARIPACIMIPEVVLITLFGLITPVLSAFFAARNILNISIAEVLHDE